MTQRIVMCLVLISMFYVAGVVTKIANREPVNLEPIIKRYEAEISDLRAEVQYYKDDSDLTYKFQDERCVCVPWSSSSSEPAMTKQQICSSPNSY